GRDASGLLRPDKLVVYFHQLADLQRTAEEIERRLGGLPAHGVPFTAGISDDGLLSWGSDPPRGHASYGRPEQESWRIWVTNRLALALLAARSSGMGSIEPWRFAIERIGLDGVDPRTWAPAQQIWQESHA